MYLANGGEAAKKTAAMLLHSILQDTSCAPFLYYEWNNFFSN